MNKKNQTEELIPGPATVMTVPVAAAVVAEVAAIEVLTKAHKPAPAGKTD